MHDLFCSKCLYTIVHYEAGTNFPVNWTTWFLCKSKCQVFLPRNHQRLKVVLVQANLLVTIDLLSKESYRVSICVCLRLGLHLFPRVQVCIIMYLCPVCVVSLLLWPGCCCVSQMWSVSEFGDAKSWPPTKSIGLVLTWRGDICTDLQ